MRLRTADSQRAVRRLMPSLQAPLAAIERCYLGVPGVPWRRTSPASRNSPTRTAAASRQRTYASRGMTGGSAATAAANAGSSAVGASASGCGTASPSEKSSLRLRSASLPLIVNAAIAYVLAWLSTGHASRFLFTSTCSDGGDVTQLDSYGGEGRRGAPAHQRHSLPMNVIMMPTSDTAT
jgi:hypothetical protein